ncbi:MAG: hypothetical protein JSV04_03410 [Candidatus Heimdallarchaeota archaeon]|nr:MAG: hypothetical protein JSV04_03410 [Candidatus Heimdallarchaeota archaeon]
MKMTGPYTYVPPIYWYSKERRGVAQSFNTETGPDVCIPPYESLLKFLPQDQQEVGSEAWNFHAGLGAFKNTKIIEEAIMKRYGEPTTLHDLTKTAQVLGYECWRSMFEAHARNYPEATGVIGWMLNSPWPSLIWQLYDYYLNTNGAFFGAKKACEPLHIQFSYDDLTIWVVNTSIKKRQNLTASVKVLTMDLVERFSESKEIEIDEYSKSYVTTIPKFSDISTVYFLDLILKEESLIVSRNFYWLSSKEDIFVEKDEWFYTPLETHANMSPLRSLPRTKIETSYNIEEINEHVEVIVQIKNISNTIAFFLRVFLIDNSSGDFLTPVYWNDNCISLLPSEEISIRGLIPLERIPQNRDISIKIDGWNY